MYNYNTVADFAKTHENFNTIFNSVGDLFERLNISSTNIYNYWMVKYSNRLVAHRLEEENVVDLISLEITTLALINSIKYKKLIDTLLVDYNPIENYNMKETGAESSKGGTHDYDSETIGSTHTSNTSTYSDESNNNNSTRSDTKTTDKATTDNYTVSYEGVESKKDKTVIDDTEQTEATASGSGSSSSTGGNQEESAFDGQTNIREHNNKSINTNNHLLTRSGNIGTTTTQQMLESERNIARYSIIDEFLNDINKIILLSVYNV